LILKHFLVDSVKSLKEFNNSNLILPHQLAKNHHMFETNEVLMHF